MTKQLQHNYISILKSELLPAMGCTEPIAVAYAAAKAREVLGCVPEHVKVYCSGNIVKNVKGVTVPNSGGMKGIDVAAVLGIMGGKADRALEVLNSVDQKAVDETKRLLEQPLYCDCNLAEGEENLYIRVEVTAGEEQAVVEIQNKHDQISRIEKNGILILDGQETVKEERRGRDGNSIVPDKSQLNLKDILEFADVVDMEEIRGIMERQIRYNETISKEGLSHTWGANVGKTLLKTCGDDKVEVRAKAAAAAGSDARMSGCALPVVINSGSGNQGMTVSLPVIEYAKELKSTEEKLYRALTAANLIAIHQKRFIGNLSAYCGAVSAGCAAACGIAYLEGASYEVISNTIVNALGNIGGMVCDGAKPSCAAKIASAVDAGILGYRMAKEGNVFQDGEGLVGRDVEQTIQNLGRMGKDGMKGTDIEILKIMLGK